MTTSLRDGAHTMITSTHEIALEPVTSSYLSAIGYDAEAREVAVQFANGHIIHYANVPPDVWEEWQQAPSKGAFYARVIKKQFSGEKITGTCHGCGDVGRLGQTCTDCGTAEYTAIYRETP